MINERKIFKLVIFGTLVTGNEERQIEVRNWAEAIKIKNTLLRGRPYYSLTEEITISRNTG